MACGPSSFHRSPAWHLVLLAALLSAVPVHHAGAQLLRLQAVEEVSGRPAAGAIVDVTDSTGATTAQVVLSADGRREVLLVRPGTYRLRVRRIGYPPFASAPIVVTTTPYELRLMLPARRVTLTAVQVTAARCAADAFTDASFVTLWDEAYKALTSISLGRAERAVFETRAFRRVLARDGRVRALEVGLPRTTTAARPYFAASARQLAQDGYVQVNEADGTMLYHGPDEDVLRSNEFIATHCFSVARGSGPTAGLFGLHFTPARRGGDVNDIEGTLWLDSATAELRHVDFRYVAARLPRAALGEGGSGGQVVFRRLPSGQWIVSAWQLRMPRFAGARSRGGSTLDGFEEFGGIVTPQGAAPAALDHVFRPYRELLVPGTLEGRVFDSLANRPLGGARVWLVPYEPPEAASSGLATSGRIGVVARPVVSDAEGRWRHTAVAPGTYRVGVEHPAIDSLGLALRWPELRIAPGETVELPLTLPSVATLLARCAPAPNGKPPAGGILTGIVRGAAGGPPPAGTVVRASWQEWSPVAADALRAVVLEANGAPAPDGSYTLCGVPIGTDVRVFATSPTDTTAADTVRIPTMRLARVQVHFAGGGVPADTIARIAGRDPHADLSGVHWRRVGGRGYTLTADALRQHATLLDAVRGLPAVRTASNQQIGGPWVLMLPREGGECQARVFLDGREVDYTAVQRIVPATLIAMELFPDRARAPVFATGVSSIGADAECGALLLWTPAAGASGGSSVGRHGGQRR